MERVRNQVEHFSYLGRKGLGTLFEVTQQAFLAATLGALLIFAPLQGQAEKDPFHSSPQRNNATSVAERTDVHWLQKEISSGRLDAKAAGPDRVR